jgi:carotenoid 1,2-hydratase
VSHNGRYGLTIIAFVGSVFSPYYAWASQHEAADPLDHCALNVALYDLAATRGGRRWTMTERNRHAVHRTSSVLAIGRSSLAWDKDALSIWIDEHTAPWPSRVRGVVRVYPQRITDCVAALDRAGQHRWWPIAPSTRVQVALDEPNLRWLGTGYLDSNWGDAPLESAFSRWDWSRASLQAGTAVLYDVQRRDGAPLSLALRFAPSGQVDALEPPPSAPLPRTRWGIERGTRADLTAPARIIRTLEDGPFYARSLLAARLFEEPVSAVHESVSFDRFRTRWVKLLLPFRMPRVKR